MTTEQFNESLNKLDKLSFNELINVIKILNYKMLSNSPEALLLGKKLKEWNYEAVNELNIKSYEGKLYKKNLKNLGPISRGKYNRLVKFSELLFTEMFSNEKNKFKSLQILIK